jgi:hypothetical protein
LETCATWAGARSGRSVIVKLHLSLVSTVIFSAAIAGAAIIRAAMAHMPSLFIL